jgi:ERCC4-related helicase
MQCLTNPSLLQKPLDNYMIGEGLVNEINIEDREIVKAIKKYSQNYIPPKFIEAKRLISKIIKEQGASGKVIIWTIFIDNIFQLQEYLKQNNINSELLYGGTPNENEDTPKELLTREKIIDKFHEEDCPYKVIIANPFAVGESISLHKACHNAIYLERNFNAAMYMQSKDRIHRYGLKDNDIINYHFLLTKDSIDEVIHKRLIEKENRMLDIIEKEEIPLLNMNMDETTDDQNDIQSIMKYYYEKQSTRN